MSKSGPGKNCTEEIKGKVHPDCENAGGSPADKSLPCVLGSHLWTRIQVVPSGLCIRGRRREQRATWLLADEVWKGEKSRGKALGSWRTNRIKQNPQQNPQRTQKPFPQIRIYCRDCPLLGWQNRGEGGRCQGASSSETTHIHKTRRKRSLYKMHTYIRMIKIWLYIT